MSKETPADVPILSLSDNAVTLQIRSGDDEPTLLKISEIKDAIAKLRARIQP